MPHRRKRLSAFAAPAHTAKLYVGQSKPTGGHVTKDELRKIVDGSAGGIGGGATKYTSGGVWVEPGHAPIREKVAVIDLVGSGADSCAKFKGRARALASRAARISKQTAVLTVVTCADGRVDADLVGPKGDSVYPLTRLPAASKKPRRG